MSEAMHMNQNHLNIPEEIDWRIRVFDSLSFPTLILKPNRKIIAANRVFLEKFNADPEEVVGKTCDHLFGYENMWCLHDKCPLNQAVKNKKGQSLLRQIKGRKGELKWEDRVFSPILDDSGQVKYVIESIRDVTRIKTLERQLTGVSRFLDSVIQSSVNAIVVAGQDGQILLMNPAAENLFGYSFDMIKYTHKLEQLYPVGVAREIKEKLRDSEFGEVGKLNATKVNIIDSRGGEIPVEITAAFIYEGEREAAIMMIYNDLREKIAVEQKLQEARMQLVQSEKMASLGQLAAGVAHEINNPLTGILLYGSMVLERLKADDSLKEDLEYVLEDAHRCKDIVKNLLAYSRQTDPSKEIIQINMLLEQSLALVRNQKLFMNIKVVKTLSDDMMLVDVDKNQLSQVIINLVINAIDAMEGQGTLSFRTYRQKRAGKVFLEICDTGEGIAPENLQKIFDPFFTTKEHGKGTGLGLSTVYGIISEHGGRISVKETGEAGTTFLIELPLFQPSDDSAVL